MAMAASAARSMTRGRLYFRDPLLSEHEYILSECEQSTDYILSSSEQKGSDVLKQRVGYS